MRNAGLFFFFRGELAHDSHGLHLHFAQDLIKDFVCQKLNLGSALNFHSVHVLQLSLALVELVKVRIF